MSFSIIGPFNFYSNGEQTNNTNSLNRILNIFRQIFTDDITQENNEQQTSSSQPTGSIPAQAQAQVQTQTQAQTQTRATNRQTTNRQTSQLDSLDNIIFYVDDEIEQNTGLTINEINNNSTIETIVDSNETICSICRQPITNICRKLNNCSHSFHVGCIDEWLVDNNTCPICRAVIPTERVVRNSPLQFRYYYNTR